MTTPKYKHFKFEDRYVIQEFLRLNYSFTAIANRLKKDQRAVSKEILKHRFLKVGANKRKLDCTKPDKPPYVCNGCLNKTSCKQNQYIYEASIAQNEYDYTRAKTKDNGIKLGRFYRDFQDFLEHNPNASIPLILWLSRFYLTGDLFMSPNYSRN